MVRERAVRTRRRFLQGSLALAAVGLLSGCGLSPPSGQPAAGGTKVRLIGVLGDAPAPRWDAFREGLRELGWVEGHNLAVESRWTEGNSERNRAFADELVRLKVELIVGGTLTASVAAKQATDTVPIVVVTGTGEALESGIVDNIARPGGNITGMAGMGGAQLGAKVLQLLKGAVPEASRVAVLADATRQAFESRVQALRSAAPALGVQLQVFPVRNPGGLEDAFSAIGAAGPHALQILAAGSWDPVWQQIADLATRHRLPAITEYAEFPQAGGLMGYGVNRPDIYRRGATYVDKILKGARPGDLPMERPTTFDFVINLKTAQAIGLTFPQSIMLQATEVIQ